MCVNRAKYIVVCINLPASFFIPYGKKIQVGKNCLISRGQLLRAQDKRFFPFFPYQPWKKRRNPRLSDPAFVSYSRDAFVRRSGFCRAIISPLTALCVNTKFCSRNFVTCFLLWPKRWNRNGFHICGRAAVSRHFALVMRWCLLGLLSRVTRYLTTEISNEINRSFLKKLLIKKSTRHSSFDFLDALVRFSNLFLSFFLARSQTKQELSFFSSFQWQSTPQEVFSVKWSWRCVWKK